MARKPGSHNLIGADAKAAVQEAFEMIGGVPALAAWAAANPYYFYVHMYAKMIPKPIEAQVQLSEGARTILNAVQVADPQSALTTLERLEDARNAHGRGRGEGDEREVDTTISPYKVHMQGTDEGSAGDGEEDYSPNAASPREDS